MDQVGAVPWGWLSPPQHYRIGPNFRAHILSFFPLVWAPVSGVGPWTSLWGRSFTTLLSCWWWRLGLCRLVRKGLGCHPLAAAAIATAGTLAVFIVLTQIITNRGRGWSDSNVEAQCRVVNEEKAHCYLSLSLAFIDSRNEPCPKYVSWHINKAHFRNLLSNTLSG